MLSQTCIICYTFFCDRSKSIGRASLRKIVFLKTYAVRTGYLESQRSFPGSYQEEASDAGRAGYPHLSGRARLFTWASGAWKPVPKSQWKNNRPARSVFKRLLVQPGRRLTRGAIEDDIWSEAENLDAVAKQVYNAISLIRGIIGKSRVTCWEATYTLADQSLIWTDLDACSALLKEAENQGAIQAVPLHNSGKNWKRSIFSIRLMSSFLHIRRTSRSFSPLSADMQR